MPLRIISELIKIQVDILIKYYADFHDVDEDGLTICDQGGSYIYGSKVGITLRNPFDAPTVTFGTVASLKT